MKAIVETEKGKQEFPLVMPEPFRLWPLGVDAVSFVFKVGEAPVKVTLQGTCPYEIEFESRLKNDR